MSKTKSNLRDQIQKAARENKPTSLKRIAPRTADNTREDALHRAEKWGVPAAYRIKPTTKEAINRASDVHNVKKGNLVDFLVLAGLELLSRGHIELPLVEYEELDTRIIKLPPVPDEYQ